MKNLVKMAKEVNCASKIKRYSKEEIELALAWMSGDIRNIQVSKILKKINAKHSNTGSIYVFLSRAIRQWYQQQQQQRYQQQQHSRQINQ